MPKWRSIIGIHSSPVSRSLHGIIWQEFTRQENLLPPSEPSGKTNFPENTVK